MNAVTRERSARLMVDCRALTQIYRVGVGASQSEVIALQGLDLSITAGEMVGIIGASGSGKSTLMSILAGLLRPSGGRAIINTGPLSDSDSDSSSDSDSDSDKDSSSDSLDLTTATSRQLDRYRRETVGFLAQEPAMIPYLSALENVALPLTMSGVSTANEESARLLELVGLADRAGTSPGRLSGGERQRVALAAALVHGPRLLLADEPTGALDSTTTGQVFDLMRSLGRETGLTQLIVSHDPQVARHVDRVVNIRDGMVATERTWTGPTGDGDNSGDGGAEDGMGASQIAEYTVVDRIGRLQLDDEHLAALGNPDRVQITAADGELRIKGHGH